MYKILALLVIIALAEGRRISFTDCGKSSKLNQLIANQLWHLTLSTIGNGEAQYVDVEGCTSEPCMFKKGSKVNVKAALRANQDTPKGTLSVTVNIGDLEIEYPGIDTNICAHVQCPIKKGQLYVINYVVETYDYLRSVSIFSNRIRNSDIM